MIGLRKFLAASVAVFFVLGLSGVTFAQGTEYSLKDKVVSVDFLAQKLIVQSIDKIPAFISGPLQADSEGPALIFCAASWRTYERNRNLSKNLRARVSATRSQILGIPMTHNYGMKGYIASGLSCNKILESFSHKSG